MPASEWALRWLARGALGVGALACAGPVHADWKDDYGRGVRAANGGDWAQVEARMRAAMAEEPGPIARARLYGQRFDPYIPRYYLGLAAYRQGRCADAVREWSDAPTRAIWSANSDLARVANAGLAECQARLAQTPPAASDPPPPAATPAPAAPGADTTPATRPPVTTTVAPAPTTAPTTAPTASPVGPAATTAAASRAPAALVAALDAYLSGRYDAVVAVDPTKLGDPRARAHALLLRAAARHTQAQLRAGDEAAPLLEQAAADVRAVRALDARLAPDPALYSPRFRAFWAQTR